MTPTTTIAITRPDDSVTLLVFVLEGRSPTLPSGAEWIADGTWRREPRPDTIEAELKKAGISYVSWRMLPDEHAPIDRRYRDAWRDRGGPIELDMPTARRIRLFDLRVERMRRWPLLDRDFNVHMVFGRNTEAQAVERQRQALRDMPVTLAPALEAAADADALDAVTLDAAIEATNVPAVPARKRSRKR